MLCESCRAGDPICNAWIACDRQVSTNVDTSPAEPDSFESTGNGCQLVYEIGFDEDDPYTEPRRVLVCQVHP